MITITNKYWANNSLVEDENGYTRIIEFSIDSMEGSQFRAVIDPDLESRIKQGYIKMKYRWQEFRFNSWKPSLSVTPYESKASSSEFVQKSTGYVVTKEIALNSEIVYSNSEGEAVEESEAVTDGEINEGYISQIVYTTIKDEYCSSLDHVKKYFDITSFSNLKDAEGAMADLFFQMHFITKILPSL